ncbi:MAG: hypothetical protein PHQ25_01360 [Acidobacteriota bacterium]|nr:hypothetical protein [Acidobacteriota bacterium]MDW3229686.1 hypothetical protein [Acidobacteriota bacterium]MDY0232337.1 hypothetical protein [Candidatus Saccharicenans sp.]
MENNVFSFPRVGKYTSVFCHLLENLGLKVLPPPPITEQTVKLGVRHSADMMCYPFKITLGNFIEAIEQGANSLIMFDSRGRCRLRHYWMLQDLTLRRLGYQFKLYPVSFSNLLSLIKKFNPELSYLNIFKKLKQGWGELRKGEGPAPTISREKVNLGLVGEIYTCLEPAINLDIEKKLNLLEVNIFNTVRLSDFIKASLRLDYREKRTYKRRAKNYLNGRLGGHGLENIYNSMYLIDRGIDGIIHLLPLSCMPETTIEPILDKICADHNIPLLRLPIDETRSEINFDTRLETFVDLIKRRKK